jgi:hypothetical protein
VLAARLACSTCFSPDGACIFPTCPRHRATSCATSVRSALDPDQLPTLINQGLGRSCLARYWSDDA